MLSCVYTFCSVCMCIHVCIHTFCHVYTHSIVCACVYTFCVHMSCHVCKCSVARAYVYMFVCTCFVMCVHSVVGACFMCACFVICVYILSSGMYTFFMCVHILSCVYMFCCVCAHFLALCREAQMQGSSEHPILFLNVVSTNRNQVSWSSSQSQDWSRNKKGGQAPLVRKHRHLHRPGDTTERPGGPISKTRKV